jgi:hypothetical protein
MAWKNSNGQYSKERPQRVRLADGMTRTGEAITDALLAELGWVEYQEEFSPPPVVSDGPIETLA